MSDSSDVRSFTVLYDANIRELVGYALRRVDTAEDAADVVAETFVVAWRRRREVPDGVEGRLWLYGVARLVVANHRRGRLRRHRLADRLQTFVERIACDPSAGSAEAMVVRQALGRIGDDDREMLRLTSWEGLTPTEIALAMGLPAPTVRTRLHRARKCLRDELENVGFDEEATRSATSGHVHSDGRSLAVDKED